MGSGSIYLTSLSQGEAKDRPSCQGLKLNLCNHKPFISEHTVPMLAWLNIYIYIYIYIYICMYIYIYILVKNPYIRAQTSGQLTASDPIRTTHENIAIYCGELPVFRKKTKDNRTWVADQEPVNMKRLEP